MLPFRLCDEGLLISLFGSIDLRLAENTDDRSFRTRDARIDSPLRHRLPLHVNLRISRLHRQDSSERASIVPLVKYGH